MAKSSEIISCFLFLIAFCSTLAWLTTPAHAVGHPPEQVHANEMDQNAKARTKNSAQSDFGNAAGVAVFAKHDKGQLANWAEWTSKGYDYNYAGGN